MKTVSIIGLGRMGAALALALSQAGFAVEKLVYRSTRPREIRERIGTLPEVVAVDRLVGLDTDIVLLTTPDTELAATAEMLASRIGGTSVLLHVSGALSSEVLAPAAKLGVATGSMHPLVSVSDPAIGAAAFRGAYFCIEGDAEAKAAAQDIVSALGGNAFSIGSKFKPLYHASAVLASGHVVALFAAAVNALAACEVDRSDAQKILLPLLQSSVANLSRQDPSGALTGPFARTDAGAVERHLRAFDLARLERERDIYVELGLEALRLAELNGAAGDEIAAIRNILLFARPASE